MKPKPLDWATIGWTFGPEEMDPLVGNGLWVRWCAGRWAGLSVLDWCGCFKPRPLAWATIGWAFCPAEMDSLAAGKPAFRVMAT